MIFETNCYLSLLVGKIMHTISPYELLWNVQAMLRKNQLVVGVTPAKSCISSSGSNISLFFQGSLLHCLKLSETS